MQHGLDAGNASQEWNCLVNSTRKAGHAQFSKLAQINACLFTYLFICGLLNDAVS
jgi:hypothetical protein